MNKSPDEEFVEKILKGLPKAPPMSPLEIKRFEKQVDALVAKEKEKSAQKNWIPRLSVAASVVALVAAVAVFSGGNEAIQNTIPDVVSSQSPQVETDKPSPGDDNEIENPPKENNDGDRTVYGENSSPTPGISKRSVPILNSGFEYSTELSSARKKVQTVAVKGNLDSLSSAQVSCSIQLGIDENLWAIDEGTYLQENIYAYYFGESASSLKIKIVGNDCNLIKDL